MRRTKKLSLTVHSATLAQGVLFLEKAEDDPDIRNLLPFSKAGSRHSQTIDIIGPNAQERTETSFTFNRRYLNCWQSEPGAWVRDFCQEHTLLAGDRLELQLVAENVFLIKRTGRPRRRNLHFIDLFAGIGGMHYAFEEAGASCVFSCEWDKFCRKSYLDNHGDIPAEDVTNFSADLIPRHDILVAGFPCQPFSLAGVSKKNSLGRPHGFLDETQGTLFYNIVEILKTKQPQAFLLENVKNLKSHDQGNTFRTICGALRELGYYLPNQNIEVIDAGHVVPQHRERIFIVGTKIGDAGIEFKMPTIEDIQKAHDGPTTTLGEILEPKPDPRYTLTDHLWDYLQKYKEKHKKAGNGFGFGLVTGEQTTRTLSARYHKDGSEILIEQPGKNPRRLTPRECARLMGFSKDHDIKGISDTQLYRQFGNAVVVPVVTAIARKLVEAVRNPKIVPCSADGYFPGEERGLPNFLDEDEVA